jgi:ribosomal protein S27AE
MKYLALLKGKVEVSDTASKDLREEPTKPAKGASKVLEVSLSCVSRPKVTSEALEPGAVAGPAERVIEATFSEKSARVREQDPIRPVFPQCAECGIARYWIAPSGKVVCGKCGHTRFLLTNIVYHVVN